MGLAKLESVEAEDGREQAPCGPSTFLGLLNPILRHALTKTDEFAGMRCL